MLESAASFNHALEATAPRCVALAFRSIGYSLRSVAALTGCRTSAFSRRRRLRGRPELNERFWSIRVCVVRMSTASSLVDCRVGRSPSSGQALSSSAEVSSRRGDRAHTQPPNHALEATAPRCVAGTFRVVGYLPSCVAPLTGRRASALIR